MEEYPAWLTGLLMPQPTLAQKIMLMHIEDNDAFMPDVTDLRVMLRQLRKKKYNEASGVRSYKAKELMVSFSPFIHSTPNFFIF